MPEGPASPGPTPSPTSSPPLVPGRRRWRLLLSYDGAGFRGFAAQPDQPTVAGALGEAMARTMRLEAPPRLVCAGRTDAGVHARGQVAHADLPDPLPVSRLGPGGTGSEALRQSLNRQLAPAVVIGRLEPAPEGFDARRSARSRHYRYLIWNAPAPDPLLAPITWSLAEPLDLRRLQSAADTLLGEHDFRSFCRRPPGTGADQPIRRRVLEAGWSDQGAPEGAGGGPARTGRLLRFDIEAGSFCHQMVRSLVAVLAEAGAGRQNTASVRAALGAAQRAGLPSPAPARGLCLTGVRYPPEMAW